MKQAIEAAFFRHDLGRRELDAIAEVPAWPILTTGETVLDALSRPGRGMK